MEKRVLIVAVLAALLCLASFAPRVAEAAIARPTKEQLKAELGKLAESVAKKRPRYSNFTSTVNNFFGLAMNSKYDLSALANATILIPINTDSEALFEKLPFKRSNFPKFYQIAAFHILRIKRYMPQLKVLKPGEAVEAPGPTLLLAAAPTLLLAPATSPERSNTAVIAARIIRFGRGEWHELISAALQRRTPLPLQAARGARASTFSPTPDDRRIARYLRLAACNETSRACAALESAEAAPDTESTMQRLRSKHPVAERPTPD
ncbi:unnamed protein product [Closterium sp. NIES-65]|nr:unnamed protein product [Closterium sp. NIES-65]